ncbi:MAG: cation transporter [Deltaproteobacteria bacterium]|nr:cation transporter [Deltaproteobacteria bacterium]
MTAGHGHGAPDPGRSLRALRIALWLNAAFLVVEAVAGWWTGSLALLSDAGHMVSDVGALLVAVTAQRLVARRPSPRFTYGLRRAPVLGGLANALSLVVIVALILVEAWERFSAPPVFDAVPVFWVGLAGLAVNVAGAAVLSGSGDRSVNVRGAMLHLIADALGSVAAIVAAGCVYFWGFALADPIASVVIALLILVGSLPLLRETVAILLQRAPAGLDLEALADRVRAVDGVQAIQDLHVWELDSGSAVVSLTIVVDVESVIESTRIADEVRGCLLEDGSLGHATVECRAPGAPDPTPAICRDDADESHGHGH